MGYQPCEGRYPWGSGSQQENAMEQFWGTKEYRAVFGNPHNSDRRVSTTTFTMIQQAMNDRPDRAEETHEYVVGVEERSVSPWQSVPLSTIAKANADG